MKKMLKAVLYSFIALIALGAGTFYVLAKQSQPPAAMNMGSMDGMSMEHDHAVTGMGHPQKEISMTSLIEPPSDAPVKTFNITAEAKEIDTGDGRQVDAWTYNGTIPGPEIRVRQGDRVIVHLKNRLSEGVTIHWHGVELPNAEDGVAGLTQDAVAPDEEFTYDFVAKKPGTYWYHSHQYSSEETSKGLYGALVVEPADVKDHPAKEYTAVIHDWDNNIYTINGTSTGEHFAANPGELIKLRIVNTASNTHKMTLIGAPFKVVAIDGSDIHEPADLNSIILPIAASQRYDVEFTMPAHGAVKLVNTDHTDFKGNFFTRLLGLKTASDAAENQMLTATFGEGAMQADVTALQKIPLFDFTTYGTSAPTADKLTLDSKFDRQYNMELGNALGFFNGGFTMKFQINQNTFPNIPSYMVKEGELVKIHVVNNTDIGHPMHLHGHNFKVLAKNGSPVSGSPVYLSTLQVGSHESYDIAFTADNPGLWMLHCHNLDHAANGMDMMLNYEGVTTPYTVGKKSGNHPD